MIKVIFVKEVEPGSFGVLPACYYQVKEKIFHLYCYCSTDTSIFLSAQYHWISPPRKDRKLSRRCWWCTEIPWPPLPKNPPELLVHTPWISQPARWISVSPYSKPSSLVWVWLAIRTENEVLGPLLLAYSELKSALVAWPATYSSLKPAALSIENPLPEKVSPAFNRRLGYEVVKNNDANVRA